MMQSAPSPLQSKVHLNSLSHLAPTDLMDTLEEEPRRHHRTKTILYCVGASWGSAAYGYGASIIATTIGQPSFLRKMGLDTAPNASALLGAANALYFVGGFFGALLVAAYADKYGRRPVMAAAAAIMLVSSALLAASVHIAMFLVFRFANGIGGYMAMTSIPLWITEIVPPKHRGALNDICPIFINVGYVSASWIGIGFFFLDTQDAWRAPLAMGCLPCLLCLVSLWFVPESPRYYLLKDRPEEAWNIICSIHTHHGDETFARHEFQQMKHQIQLERSLDASYLQMVKRPSYRKRVLMAIFLVFTCVSSGVLVINNYATLIYGALGYSNKDQLFLQAGWVMAAFLFNMLAPIWVDRMPRPRLMLIGFSGCVSSVVIQMALLASYGDTTNKAALGACVAFLYLFVSFYGGFLDGVTWWYTGEIFPTHIRAHGMTIGMATYAVTNIVWLQAAPTAFKNIGWRYYLFFIAFTSVGTIIIWLTFPDTLNKPLEEIAALFGDDDLVAAYEDYGLAEGGTGLKEEAKVCSNSQELEHSGRE
ncbi:hypothetical protein RBB50_012832 [Rhinocladiella similis]